MNQAQKTDKVVSIKSNATAPAVPERVRQRVAEYWRRLGLADPALVERLTEESLVRAGRRVGQRAAEQELLRRALEEAQRRFDHALARALRLPPSKDTQPVAAARAAFLLAQERPCADSLFQTTEPLPEIDAQLRAVLPCATPPEAPLAMSETPFRFWLFQSTHR